MESLLEEIKANKHDSSKSQEYIDALLQIIEKQNKVINAYETFEDEVSSASHKVYNDRLESAIEILESRLSKIKNK